MVRKADNTNNILKVVKSEAVYPNSNEIVLSTGVVLAAVRVSSSLFTDLVRRYKRPKPPRVFIEDLGREEPNPDDPDFKSDVVEYESNIGMGMIDLMIMMGTKLISVPKDFPKVEDTGWAKKLRILGYEIDDDPDIRYMQWVKYIASSDEDLGAITVGVGRISGVSEADAKEAATRFRRKP